MKHRVVALIAVSAVACTEASDAETAGSTSTTGASDPRGSSTAPDPVGSTSTSSTVTTGTASPSSSGEEVGTTEASSSSGEPPAPASPQGRVVIDEVYFTGAEPLGEVDHYFSDQFIALRNNSDVPVAMGGLMLADVFGIAGAINPGTEPDPLLDDPDHVYLSSVWMVPGAPEDVVLEPGARLVIAQDGTNHTPFSTLDLSGADFETFVAHSEQDDDSPTVENLELLHYNGGFDWLIPVFGPSVVLIDSAEPLTTHEHQGWTLVTAPASSVVDGVDILMDADSSAFKRLPTVVDTGFTFASGTYVGEAVRRRRDDDGRSVDTDDSSTDFEPTTAPDPRY